MLMCVCSRPSTFFGGLFFLALGFNRMGSMGLSLVTLYTTGWKAKLVYALTCSVVLCGSAWYERLSRWHFENIS